METPVIVGLLVIAAVWSFYLLPVVFGERSNAPINSTEEFDRWTHSMAYVQKQSAADLAASHRDVVRQRRRRTILVLGILTASALFGAWYLSSMALLLAGLFFGSLIALYLAVLHQMKQRREQRLKVTHVSERPSDWEEPQIKVIAR
jgi:hypothetical protein